MRKRNGCSRRDRAAARAVAWASLCILAVGCSAGDKAPPAPAVQVALIAERSAWVAGQTNWLGVHFRLAEPWHLYWNGLNDTGLPPSIALQLPEGWTVGDVVWPAPERHLSAGGILDHVYHDALLLLVPVSVPEGSPADPDGLVAVSGSVKWLACAEVCVPGQQQVTLALPWVAGGAPAAASSWLELFASVRRALPRDLPPGNDTAAPVRWRWDGATLQIAVTQARSLEFYPHADCGALTDLIADGAADGGSLELRFAHRTDAATGRSTIGPARGVLAVTDAAGDRKYWKLSVPAPVAGGGI